VFQLVNEHLTVPIFIEINVWFPWGRFVCKDGTDWENQESNKSNCRCLETFAYAYFVRKIDARL